MVRSLMSRLCSRFSCRAMSTMGRSSTVKSLMISSLYGSRGVACGRPRLRGGREDSSGEVDMTGVNFGRDVDMGIVGEGELW